MNIRQAILKAADSIEQNPDMFDYESLVVPDCGTPGCALGWVAYHSGIDIKAFDGGQGFHKYWAQNREFMRLMNEGVSFSSLDEFEKHWISDAHTCANALRQYADKYHPIKHQRFHQALIPADSDYEWNKVTV